MNIDLLAMQDGKGAVRSVVVQLREKYNLPNCIISGILGEVLADVRDAELSDIMMTDVKRAEKQESTTA